MPHDHRSPLSSLARAAAAFAAALVTCSLFYGVIIGMAGDTTPPSPFEISLSSSDGG